MQKQSFNIGRRYFQNSRWYEWWPRCKKICFRKIFVISITFILQLNIDLYSFEDGQWKLLLTQKGKMCEMEKKFAGEFALELEKAAGIPNGCPYSKVKIYFIFENIKSFSLTIDMRRTMICHQKLYILFQNTKCLKLYMRSRS